MREDLRVAHDAGYDAALVGVAADLVELAPSTASLMLSNYRMRAHISREQVEGLEEVLFVETKKRSEVMAVFLEEAIKCESED